MTLQTLKEIRTAPLHREQQEAEKIEKRYARINTDIGARAAHFLDCEILVCLAKAAGKEEEELIGSAEVARKEEREDCSRCVEASGMCFVFRVPIVLQACEVLCRVFRAEGKVFFGIIWLQC